MKSTFSLFAVFFSKWWKRYSKCVSPLIMGAVLALCCGLDSYAAAYTSGTFSEAFVWGDSVRLSPNTSQNILQSNSFLNWSLYPTYIDVIDINSGLNMGSFTINAVDDSLSISYNSSSREEWWQNSTGTAGGSTSSTNGSGTVQAPEYTIDFDDVSFDSQVTLIAHYDREYYYYLFYRNLIEGQKPSTAVYDVVYATTGCNVNVKYRQGIGMDWVALSASDYQHIGFKNYWNLVRFDYQEKINNDMIKLGIDLNHMYVKENVTEFSISDFLLQLQIEWLPSSHASAGEIWVSYVDLQGDILGDIEDNTGQIADQQQQYHVQDQTDATQAGQDMTGFAAQLDNLKNTWSILWYPIEFTNRFVQVFTGGTQAAAYDDYNYISGYRYNNDTGMLEPMMSRSIQPRSAGTGITFPSIQLMGYTLWEPYTYDLSTLKDQFPVIFDALYVFVSMLEVFWFVGFLRSKYNEVFG